MQDNEGGGKLTNIMRAGRDLPTELFFANLYQTLEHIMRTPSETNTLFVLTPILKTEGT